MSFIYPRNIRFKCLKCGICCGNTQERTRHVLLLDEEANEIAKATNQPIAEFAIEIEKRAPYRYEMKKTKEDGKCVFLKENRCVIYSKRPIICRFYPFGFTNHKQQKTFYYTKECPGIGKGLTMNEIDFNKLLRQANPLQRIMDRKSEDRS
jgi:Fe-S-cluster containining protein